MKLFPLALVLSAAINSCIGNLLLKSSRIAVPQDASAFAKLLSPSFVGGMLFYGINVVLFAKALDDMDVSVAYPILAGAGFILLAVASTLIFKEPITTAKATGIALILIGILIISPTG